MMISEIKISLPLYKMIYAAFFVVILSIIRGVTFTYEIGISLEAPMAILAAVFCADTYTQEIISKRSQVQRLYPMKKRTYSAVMRIAVQEMFLWILAMLGYGLFFVFQTPFSHEVNQNNPGSEMVQFLVYSLAIFITLLFWGILSNTLACISRNMWFGIAGSLLVWITTNSNIGNQLFKEWNLFSYTFRNVENASSDYSWICGKSICILVSIIMMAALPKILKKRG